MDNIFTSHQNMHFQTVNKNLRMTGLYDWRKLEVQDRGANSRDPHLFVVKFHRPSKAAPLEILDHTIRIYRYSPTEFKIEWETISTKDVSGTIYIDIVKGSSSDKNKAVDIFLYGLYSNLATKKELNSSEKILNTYLDERFRYCESLSK